MWLDQDGNGRWDDAEPGAAGVQLTLLRTEATRPEPPDGEILIAVTTALGVYEFGGLSAGNYTVELVDSPGLKPTTLTKVGVALAHDAASAEVRFGVMPIQNWRIYLPLVTRR